MATQPDWVSNVRWFATTQTGTKGPQGRGSLTVGDALYIQFAIFNDRDGNMRVVLPSRKNVNFDESQPASKENRRYYEEVGCVDNDVRIELTNYLVEKLLAERDRTQVNEENIPF